MSSVNAVPVFRSVIVVISLLNISVAVFNPLQLGARVTMATAHSVDFQPELWGDLGVGDQLRLDWDHISSALVKLASSRFATVRTNSLGFTFCALTTF
jgi:hypothetical protein